MLTTSLKVAEVFEKRHDHVLESIRDLIGQIEGIPKIGETPLFQESTYINEQNKQEYPMYLMNRDGFSLLVMGFTGKKALQWKLAYIQAFNQMESKLIQLLAERKSAEWQDIRLSTKTGQSKLMDVVEQKLIPLALEQGIDPQKAKRFFSNYNRMINICLGIKSGDRDNLSAKMLYELDKMLGMTADKASLLADEKLDYHQIYSETKEFILDYSSHWLKPFERSF